MGTARKRWKIVGGRSSHGRSVLNVIKDLSVQPRLCNINTRALTSLNRTIYKFYFPRPEHGANAGSHFCVWLVSYVDDGVSRAFPSNRRPRGFKTDAHVTTVEWSGKDDPRTLRW